MRPSFCQTDFHTFLFEATIHPTVPYNQVLPITKRIVSKGYYVLYKGIDPAGYGVTDIKILNAKMDQFAQVVGKLNLEYPPHTFSRFKRSKNNRP
ncbi:MAG TPA: hypothetical protein PL004_00005 [Bacillota bacterium]|nr:hypothetical protein [Bacillota bacterium]